MIKVYLVLEWCGDFNDVVACFENWVHAKKYCKLKDELSCLGLSYTVEECNYYSKEFIRSIEDEEYFKFDDIKI